MYEDVVLRGFHTLTQDVLKSDVYTSSSYLSILAKLPIDQYSNWWSLNTEKSQISQLSFLILTFSF